MWHTQTFEKNKRNRRVKKVKTTKKGKSHVIGCTIYQRSHIFFYDGNGFKQNAFLAPKLLNFAKME